MGCPNCGGTASRTIAGTLVECTGTRRVLVHRQEHPDRPADEVYDTVPCSGRWQQGTGTALCACGLYSVGVCPDCGRAVCGNCIAPNRGAQCRDCHHKEQSAAANAAATALQARREAWEAWAERVIKGEAGPVDAEAIVRAGRIVEQGRDDLYQAWCLAVIRVLGKPDSTLVWATRSTKGRKRRQTLQVRTENSEDAWSVGTAPFPPDDWYSEGSNRNLYLRADGELLQAVHFQQSKEDRTGRFVQDYRQAGQDTFVEPASPGIRLSASRLASRLGIDSNSGPYDRNNPPPDVPS